MFKWRITKLIQRAFAFWRWGSTVVFFRTWPLSYTRAKLRISTSFSEAMVLCEKMVDYSLRVAAPSEEVKYFRILILSDDWDGPVDECNCSSLPRILITVTGGGGIHALASPINLIPLIAYLWTVGRSVGKTYNQPNGGVECRQQC